MKSVLFVCTGNTCRSPLAEALFREALGGRSDVEVKSAGVSAFPGQAMSRESASILQERGIDPSTHRSQPVTDDLVAAATHIFAMTSGHLALLLDEFPDAQKKVFLAGGLANVDGLGTEIPDPFGMGTEAYREVARVLDAVIPSLIAEVGA